MLENCEKFARKLSWKACIWPGKKWATRHSMVGQQACKISHKTDSGIWKTISKADFLHSSYERLSSMSACGKHGTTLRVCFKTETLLALLRTRNEPRVWSCVFLEVEHVFPPVGCARHKLRSRTVLQSLRLFLWMPNCVWMGYLLLIFGTSWLKYNVKPTTMSNPNIQAFRKLVRLFIPKPTPRKSKEDRRLINWVMWIMCPQTHILLKMSLSCTFLKTTKPWSTVVKIKNFLDEVQRRDTCPEPTELLLIGCLTESIRTTRYLTPKTNSQTFWPKEISQEMNGITFLQVCSTSWISRCILEVISVVIFFLTIRLESRAPCQKEVRRRLRMKALRRRKRRPCLVAREQSSEEISFRNLGSLVNPDMPMKEKKSY